MRVRFTNDSRPSYRRLWHAISPSDWCGGNFQESDTTPVIVHYTDCVMLHRGAVSRALGLSVSSLTQKLPALNGVELVQRRLRQAPLARGHFERRPPGIKIL